MGGTGRQALRRGEIWLVCLDPVIGSEIQKTRPCVIVSSSGLDKIPVRIVVPLTGWRPKHEDRPWCICIKAEPGNGLEKASAADALQVRCVSIDSRRFVRRLGTIEASALEDVVMAVGLCLDHPPPAV